MGPTPIGWTKVYAPGTKVRLVTFNYSSFEQMPSFRNSQLSQGICHIINGKRSDPRSKLPINCDVPRETEERAQHLFRPDFHLILPLTNAFLTNKSFFTEAWRHINSVCWRRNATPKSSPVITNHLKCLHTLNNQPTNKLTLRGAQSYLKARHFPA